MRKTNRITDIASCGQNVFCVRQQLRASGQVKKAACLVTHPGESLHGVLVYFLYLFSPGHNVLFFATSGRYRSACVDKQLFREGRGWREKLAIEDVSHTGFSI